MLIDLFNWHFCQPFLKHTVLNYRLVSKLIKIIQTKMLIIKIILLIAYWWWIYLILNLWFLNTKKKKNKKKIEHGILIIWTGWLHIILFIYFAVINKTVISIHFLWCLDTKFHAQITNPKYEQYYSNINISRNVTIIDWHIRKKPNDLYSNRLFLHT